VFLTLLTPIWPHLCVCPLVSIEVFLFMTHPGTESALLFHRGHCARGGFALSRRGKRYSVGLPRGGDERDNQLPTRYFGPCNIATTWVVMGAEIPANPRPSAIDFRVPVTLNLSAGYRPVRLLPSMARGETSNPRTPRLGHHTLPLSIEDPRRRSTCAIAL
jgi:hypothetical protein